MNTTRDYYKEILHSIFFFMLSTESDPAQLQAIIEEALSAARTRPRVLDPERRMEGSAAFGTVFYRWFRDPLYLDADASPRPLRLRGRSPSIASLLRSEGISTADTEIFLTKIVKLKLVRKVSDRMYLPVGQVAVFQHLGPELIEHIGASFARLLSTVQHNTRVENHRSPLVERAASVADLPERDIPAFREFTQVLAKSFLASVDDWLETRRANARGSRMRVKPVGVHVYAYLSP